MSLDRVRYENRLRDALSPIIERSDFTRQVLPQPESTDNSYATDTAWADPFFSPAAIEANLDKVEAKMRAMNGTEQFWKSDLSDLHFAATTWRPELMTSDQIKDFITSCHIKLTKPLTMLIGEEFKQWIESDGSETYPRSWHYYSHDGMIESNINSLGEEYAEWIKTIAFFCPTLLTDLNPIYFTHGSPAEYSIHGRSVESDAIALKMAYARRYLSRLMASMAPEILNNALFNPKDEKGRLLRDIMFDLFYVDTDPACPFLYSPYERFQEKISVAFDGITHLTKKNLALYTSVAGIEASQAFVKGLQKHLLELNSSQLDECASCVPLLLSADLIAQARAVLQSKPTRSAGETLKSNVARDKLTSAQKPLEVKAVPLTKLIEYLQKADALQAKKENLWKASRLYELVIVTLRSQRAAAPFLYDVPLTSSVDAAVELRALLSLVAVMHRMHCQKGNSISASPFFYFEFAQPFLDFLKRDTESLSENARVIALAGNTLLKEGSRDMLDEPELAKVYFNLALTLDQHNKHAKKGLQQLLKKGKITSVNAAIAIPPASPSGAFTPAAAAATPSPVAKAAVKPLASVTPQRSTSAIAAAIATPPDAPSGVINLVPVTPQRSASAAAMTTPPASPSQAAVRPAAEASSAAALMGECWKERTVVNGAAGADNQRRLGSRSASIVKRS